MANTGATSPTVNEVVAVAGAGMTWQIFGNGVKVGDGVGSVDTVENYPGQTLASRDLVIQLTDAGALVGNDKADTTTNYPSGGFPFAVDITYGGSTDLWGATLTPAIVNGATFGLSVRSYVNDGGISDADSTNILRAKTFAFAVPADGLILGVTAMVRKSSVQHPMANQTEPWLHWVQLTIYYAVPPDAPATISVTKVGGSRLDVAWTAPASDGGSVVTGYLIERKIAAGAYATVVAASDAANLLYSDTGLTPNTLYTYRISAINAAGTGTSISAGETTPAGINFRDKAYLLDML